ncbi:MAG: hypothetical protein KAH57_04035 [Thermoplasmata archaeon]|nr:hypothetical protein [Thermoplasmata archaeon]
MPLMEVEEVLPAFWSYPRTETCLVTAAAWNGCGSSLYPSIAPEPFPGAEGSLGPIDSDGDGVPDESDDFPNDPNETTDTDGDGIGNNADTDDDNDGMPDSWELEYGLDSLDPADFDQDPDGDGYTNLEEFRADTDPQDKGSHPEEGQSEDRLLLIVLIALAVVGAAAVVVFLLSRKKGPQDLREE